MAATGKSSEKEPPAGNPRSSDLTAKLLIVAAVTTVVGFAALFATWMQAGIGPGEATLQIASRQYSLGNFRTASDLAEQSTLGDEPPQELNLLREFLIGAGQASEALLIEDVKQRRASLYVALPHLQTAVKGWPLGREDEGDRLLGLSLYQIGDYVGAIEALDRCIDRNAAFREELVPIVVECLLYGEKQAASLGLEALDLVDSSTLRSDAARDDWDTLRAQCLIRLNRYEDARKLLADIEQRISTRVQGADAPTFYRMSKVSLYQAIADVSEAIERFGKGKATDTKVRADAVTFLANAMTRLNSLQRDATPDISNQASLWAARALACSAQPLESIALLTAVRQQQPFIGASIAAGIEEIEWLAEAGKGDEALQTVRYILRAIGNEQNYDGSAIDLVSFRSRLVAAMQVLREQNRFDECVAIAKTLPTLFPQADAYYEEAISHRQAAEQMVESIRNSSREGDPETIASIKKRFRAAGDAFAASAKLRFDTEQYCDTLWQAIEAYEDSGQFATCVELLGIYLQYEDRRKQPRALLALGKAALATGDPAGALVSLEDCIVEFPRDPVRYDARLHSALALAESQRYAEAEAMLESNLTDSDLTPDSPVWRDSLYALGELLFQQGNDAHLKWDIARKSPSSPQAPSMDSLREAQPFLEKAILRLQEASTRYWPDPRAKHATYLNARAHQLASAWLKLQTESTDVLDAAKRQIRIQADQHLTAALAGFTALRQNLASQEEELPLGESQEAMLRNCYVAEADTLFELGRFEQSAEAFRGVSLRYMNAPPALEAMLGQARCLRELNRPQEARLVIRQANVILKRIPPESEDSFLKTTRYDRKRWKELLNWLDRNPMPEDSDA